MHECAHVYEGGGGMTELVPCFCSTPYLPPWPPRPRLLTLFPEHPKWAEGVSRGPPRPHLLTLFPEHPEWAEGVSRGPPTAPILTLPAVWLPTLLPPVCSLSSKIHTILTQRTQVVPEDSCPLGDGNLQLDRVQSWEHPCPPQRLLSDPSVEYPRWGHVWARLALLTCCRWARCAQGGLP